MSIYVLSNPSMPGLLKIGKTSRTVPERMKELFGTGVATPFVLEFSKKVEWDLDDTERRIHRLLRTYRVNTSREFFKIDVQEAYYILDKYFHSEYETVAEVLEDVDAETRVSVQAAYLQVFNAGRDTQPEIQVNQRIYKIQSSGALSFVCTVPSKLN